MLYCPLIGLRRGELRVTMVEMLPVTLKSKKRSATRSSSPALTIFQSIVVRERNARRKFQAKAKQTFRKTTPESLFRVADQKSGKELLSDAGVV